MDKRGVKILISCILCTVIVSILFLLAFRISRLTCELVSVEPQRLRAAQLAAFDKKRNKPIRSHDKMMLMKISAYLEYNIMRKEEDDELDDNDHDDHKRHKKLKTTTTTSERPRALASSPTPAANGSSSSLAGATPVQLNSNSSQPSTRGGSGQHPSPSQPQLGFSSQQLANSSFAHSRGPGSGGPPQLPMQRRVKRRFLPLELDSIESRDKGTQGSGDQLERRQKYILSFNCTKLNMLFVYRNNKVYVESMKLELKPTSNHKSSCELEMPKGLFEVSSAAAAQTSSAAASKGDHFAHYFCNKPLTYSCRHYSQHGPSSSNGLLLAELHISAIEFETATLAASAHGDRKHVKNEFKSRRSECTAAA